MREELAKIKNVRARFRAIVVRFGERTSHGHAKPMMLVQDVCDLKGNRMTDHVWFDKGKWIETLDLQPGDEIEFNARVRPYWKGYIDKQLDYKFNNPTKVVKRNIPLPDIPDQPRLPMPTVQERLFA